MYRCANCKEGFCGPLSFSQHKKNKKCIPADLLPSHGLKQRIKSMSTAQGKIKIVNTGFWELTQLPTVYGPRPSPRIYRSGYRLPG